MSGFDLFLTFQPNSELLLVRSESLQHYKSNINIKLKEKKDFIPNFSCKMTITLPHSSSSDPHNRQQCLLLTGIVPECRPWGNYVWNSMKQMTLGLAEISLRVFWGLEGTSFCSSDCKVQPRDGPPRARISKSPRRLAICGKDHTKPCYFHALSHAPLIPVLQFYRLVKFWQTYGRHTLISCMCFDRMFGVDIVQKECSGKMPSGALTYMFFFCIRSTAVFPTDSRV